MITTLQVNDLTPQVITAARVLFANPNNQAAVEHFDQMKSRWAGNVERLRALVDEAVDTPALINAEGNVLYNYWHLSQVGRNIQHSLRFKKQIK